MRLVFFITLLGGLCILVLAVWPNLPEDTVFGVGLMCFAPIVMVCWFVLVVTLAVIDLKRLRQKQRPTPWGLRTGGILCITLVLFWLHVPERIAFWCYQSEFEQLVNDRPADAFAAKGLGRQIGPYQVDKYAADSRGGVFFRTRIGPHGFAPSEVSYGFAFQPNGLGSPFGGAYYRQFHLFGDWYTFEQALEW